MLLRVSYFVHEHTGELELRLQAPNLPKLFHEAARALAELMAGAAAQPSSADASTRDAEQAGLDVTIELQAVDRDALLVDWLNELIFLSEREGKLFDRVSIEGIEEEAGPEAVLRARVGGNHIETPALQVKAATFHGLHIHQAPEGWVAQVVLDI
jgi:SHS2 domain-containing protein